MKLSEKCVYHWVDWRQQWFIGQTLPVKTLEPPVNQSESIYQRMFSSIYSIHSY